jgi:ankyrin repeat protein
VNTNIRRKQALNAIKAGNLKRLQTLILSKAEANLTLPKRSWSLLDQAVDCENHDIAKWLLARGANPNTLHATPGLMSRLGLDRIFAFHSIEPDFYFSPLATAIEKEDAHMVRVFLDAGADLNLPKYNFQGHIETCEDALKEKPALRARLEALAISASSGESNHHKRVSRRGL